MANENVSTSTSATNFAVPNGLGADSTSVNTVRPQSNQGAATNFERPTNIGEDKLNVHTNTTPKPIEPPKPVEPPVVPQAPPKPEEPPIEPPTVKNDPEPEKVHPQNASNKALSAAHAVVSNSAFDAATSQKGNTTTFTATAGGGNSRNVGDSAVGVGVGFANQNEKGVIIGGAATIAALNKNGYGGAASLFAGKVLDGGNTTVRAEVTTAHNQNPRGDNAVSNSQSVTVGFQHKVNDGKTALSADVGAITQKTTENERVNSALGKVGINHTLNNGVNIGAAVTADKLGVGYGIGISKIRHTEETVIPTVKLFDKPDAPKAEARTTNFNLAMDSNTLFGHDKDTLTEKGRQHFAKMYAGLTDKAVLNGSSVIDYMVKNGLPIHVDGYTDVSGSNQYNQALSERRTAAVVKFFEELGAPKGLFVARGHGESMAKVSEAEMQQVYQSAMKEGREQGLHGRKLTEFAMNKRNEHMAGDRRTEVNIGEIPNVNEEAIAKHAILARSVKPVSETVTRQIQTPDGGVKIEREVVALNSGALDNQKSVNVTPTVAQLNPAVLDKVAPQVETTKEQARQVNSHTLA